MDEGEKTQIENYHKNSLQMSIETRQQIDDHLKQMSSISSNLGRDSSVDDRIHAKVETKKHLDEIKKLNIDFYKLCVTHPNSKDIL